VCYGTSITHGAYASSQALSYPAVAARALDVDVRNLGLAGSAFCEPEMAAHIAGLDWDVATAEISVNMIEAGWSLDDFTASSRAFLLRLAENSSRRVYCISPVAYYREAGLRIEDYGVVPQVAPPAALGEYRASLERTVREAALPNLELVDGRELLPGLGGLCADLIHPFDEGMIAIGSRLAERLRPAF
jgi:hypothetical protein